MDLSYGVPLQRPASVVGAAKHLPGVDALVNPWSDAAKGSKIPDDDATLSVPATVRSIFTIATNSHGEALFALQAQPDRYPGYECTTVSSGNTTGSPTVNALTNTDYAAWSAQFNEFRVVSWGVRVYSNLPATEAQGTLKFMTISEQSGYFPSNRDFSGTLFQEVENFPVYNSDVYWVSTPLGVGWKDYIPMQSVASWTSCVVHASGLPASKGSALVVEVVYNVEFSVDLNSIASRIATPAAVHNPMVLAAASKVNTAKSTHSSRESMFSTLAGLAKNALLDVAEMYLPNVVASVPRMVSNAILGKKKKQVKRIGN